MEFKTLSILQRQVWNGGRCATDCLILKSNPGAGIRSKPLGLPQARPNRNETASNGEQGESKKRCYVFNSLKGKIDEELQIMRRREPPSTGNGLVN
jgi:hypothetical protein